MKDTKEAREMLREVIKRWDALPIRRGVEAPGLVYDQAWQHLCRCADDEVHAIMIVNYIADAIDAHVPRFAEVAVASVVTRECRYLNRESAGAK